VRSRSLSFSLLARARFPSTIFPVSPDRCHSTYLSQVARGEPPEGVGPAEFPANASQEMHPQGSMMTPQSPKVAANVNTFAAARPPVPEYSSVPALPGGLSGGVNPSLTTSVPFSSTYGAQVPQAAVSLPLGAQNTMLSSIAASLAGGSRGFPAPVRPTLLRALSVSPPELTGRACKTVT
jgi:hypothetical protein